jgi:beta-mannosidase
LQYSAKRFYSPVRVSPHEEGDNVRFYVASDRPRATPATLQVRRLDSSATVRVTSTGTRPGTEARPHGGF